MRSGDFQDIFIELLDANLGHAKSTLEAAKVPSGHVQALSVTLLEQQLQYYGDILRKPSGDVIWVFVFQQDGLKLNQPPGRRRKGHPRDTWTNKAHSIAITLAATEQNLKALAGTEHTWCQAVCRV